MVPIVMNSPDVASAPTSIRAPVASVIFLSVGPVNDQTANLVARLLFLEARIPTRTSRCTSTARQRRSAGMSIFDTMQFIKPQVSTLCMGMGRQHGRLPAVGGAPGKRFALPNSKIMIHQPLGGAQGQATDIEIHAREILKTRERSTRSWPSARGQPFEKIQERHRARQLHVRRRGADLA